MTDVNKLISMTRPLLSVNIKVLSDDKILTASRVHDQWNNECEWPFCLEGSIINVGNHLLFCFNEETIGKKKKKKNEKRLDPFLDLAIVFFARTYVTYSRCDEVGETQLVFLSRLEFYFGNRRTIDTTSDNCYTVLFPLISIKSLIITNVCVLFACSFVSLIRQARFSSRLPTNFRW